MKNLSQKINVITLIMLLFSSCATLFNQPQVRVNIFSDTDSVRVNLNNSPVWHELPATFYVYRSNKSLTIIAQKDTIQKQFDVRRKVSTTYWLGNYFNFYGYIIDLTTPKRFTYPQTILINFANFANNTFPYQTFLPPQRNLFDIKLAITGGNQNVNGNNLGFWGISAGFGYYFSDNYCLKMSLGRLTNFANPDIAGKYIHSSASYENVKIGSYYKRIHYDAGLHFKRTTFIEKEIQMFPSYVELLFANNTQNHIGLAFSTNIRLSKYFDLGLNYYPSFVVLDKNPKFDYSHLFFGALSYRIEMYRK